ncbi:MAG: hemerythrin domain-containing protein [Pyrinomonadaceae bacterium]
MDVFELLKSDHEKVSTIFTQLEPLGEADAAQRRQLFTQLKQELDLHAQLEETLLYPRLKAVEETQDITIEAIEEHQEVKDLLAELEATAPENEEWNDLLLELKENVEHHVEEEENEMFPQARQVLSQQEINEIGSQIQAAKQQHQSGRAASATNTNL